MGPTTFGNLSNSARDTDELIGIDFAQIAGSGIDSRDEIGVRPLEPDRLFLSAVGLMSFGGVLVAAHWENIATESDKIKDLRCLEVVCSRF